MRQSNLFSLPIKTFVKEIISNELKRKILESNSIINSGVLVKLLFLLIAVILSLFLASCCKDCLLSRAEISWVKTTETSGIYTTEIRDGDKLIEVSSLNGGTLKTFTLDRVSIFVPQDNDMLLKDIDSGKSIKVIKQKKYDSNDKNTVSVESLLGNYLKLHNTYWVNLEPGDLFISRKIENEGIENKTISLIQTLSVKPGGYLIVPLSIISKYPSRFITYDYAKKRDYNPSISDSKIVNENLIYATKGKNITLQSDASDGWFGYVLEDKMLLVKYSMQYYKRTDNPLIFTAKITQDRIDFSFGETIKKVTNENYMEASTRIVLVNIDTKAQSVQDVENAMDYIKVPLILIR